MDALFNTHVDLTPEPLERILSICHALVGCDALVLHGSNQHPALPQLEPRQANDASKASGNQLAVYASVDVDAVLMHAVLNRAYLSHRLGSYTIGYRYQAGTRVFRASRNLYSLFKNKDAQVCADGFVYALDKSCFCSTPQSSAEFFSPEPVTPHWTLKVPASLGNYLFQVDTLNGCDTVVPYSAQDEYALALHARSIPSDSPLA